MIVREQIIKCYKQFYWSLEKAKSYIKNTYKMHWIWMIKTNNKREEREVRREIMKMDENKDYWIFTIKETYSDENDKMTL